MKVKLLADIFLTGSKSKKAGEIVDAVEKDGKLYITYKTCCSNGSRELREEEYELAEND